MGVVKISVGRDTKVWNNAMARAKTMHPRASLEKRRMVAGGMIGGKRSK